jgi:hypothetical protein
MVTWRILGVDYRKSRFFRLATCHGMVLFAFVLASCRGNADLASVRGTVTLDGQPLPNAFVVFCPTKTGTTSYGKTDADGHYQMIFKDSEPGAWIGENLVRISTGDLGSGGKAGSRERVPVVYNARTTLKVDVQSGKNAFDFDLKSSAGKIVQPLAD